MTAAEVMIILVSGVVVTVIATAVGQMVVICIRDARKGDWIPLMRILFWVAAIGAFILWIVL